MFLMHGHSFEPICTKFGTWNPYTLRKVKGELASAARARDSRSARRLYTPLQMGGELRQAIRN